MTKRPKRCANCKRDLSYVLHSCRSCKRNFCSPAVRDCALVHECRREQNEVVITVERPGMTDLDRLTLGEQQSYADGSWLGELPDEEDDVDGLIAEPK